MHERPRVSVSVSLSAGGSAERPVTGLGECCLPLVAVRRGEVVVRAHGWEHAVPTWQVRPDTLAHRVGLSAAAREASRRLDRVLAHSPGRFERHRLSA